MASLKPVLKSSRAVLALDFENIVPVTKLRNINCGITKKCTQGFKKVNVKTKLKVDRNSGSLSLRLSII